MAKHTTTRGDLVAGTTTHKPGSKPGSKPATSGNFFAGSGRVTFKGKFINGDKTVTK